MDAALGRGSPYSPHSSIFTFKFDTATSQTPESASRLRAAVRAAKLESRCGVVVKGKLCALTLVAVRLTRGALANATNRIDTTSHSNAVWMWFTLPPPVPAESTSLAPAPAAHTPIQPPEHTQSSTCVCRCASHLQNGYTSLLGSVARNEEPVCRRFRRPLFSPKITCSRPPRRRMALSGYRGAGSGTTPPRRRHLGVAILVVIACTVSAAAASAVTAADAVVQTTVTSAMEARILQEASSPSPSPVPATLNVSKGSSGSSTISVGAVVGIAVAGGVVVGVAVGVYVAFRFHARKSLAHAALVDDADDGSAPPVRHAFASPDDILSEQGRSMWDGAAPLSAAGRREADGVVVDSSRPDGSKVTVRYGRS